MLQTAALHLTIGSMFGHPALMGNVLMWIHQECHFSPCIKRIKPAARMAQLIWIELPVRKLLKASPKPKIEQRDRS
jgi:hypothetical protein